MIRDVEGLSAREFDIAVVGGGIFGIAIAREAALQGLSVALIERDDFASAASANSLKMVHGGIRYLQHADLPRIRESVWDRRTLLRVAPHLVEPLPIVIPTSGWRMRGRGVLRAGMAAYDALAWDRNRGIADPARRIPSGRLISRAECLRQFPMLPERGVTGGALFYDAQMYNPPRLALAFLRSAVEDAGAVAANYVEATGFIQQAGRVSGVRARDVLTGSPIDIRARLVINAAGGWAGKLLGDALGMRLQPPPTFSRDTCFIVSRRLFDGPALAIQGSTQDPDALVSTGARHLFLVPWRNYTLVGVWHGVHRDPDHIQVTERELSTYLAEVNEACAGLDLTREDVGLWNAGLVLFGENRPDAVHLSYGKRSRIIDHEGTHRLPGLITVLGVRFTTAPGVAQRALRLANRRLGRRTAPFAGHRTPVFGGAIEQFEAFLAEATSGMPADLPDATRRQLARNYGTAYVDVLRDVDHDHGRLERLGNSDVIAAEVAHAVRNEAAVRLADVVLRRTELGSGAYPGEAAIHRAAELMGEELRWTPSHKREEVDHLLAYFRSRGAHVSKTIGSTTGSGR